MARAKDEVSEISRLLSQSAGALNLQIARGAVKPDTMREALANAEAAAKRMRKVMTELGLQP